MSLPIKFTVEYNASEGGMGNYTEFIVTLRSHDELTVRHVRTRPVLRQLQRQASLVEWFHVVLRTSDHHITLRIRTDTLYLDAYQTETGHWFEFGRVSILGFTPLGFGADYGSRLGETMIGRAPLVSSINYLATSNNDDSRTTRRHLIVLMVMVCEATRFHSISHELIAPLFSRNLTSRLDGHGVDENLDDDDRLRRSQYMAQIGGWGNLSEAVLRTDAIGGQWFPQFPHMGITTLDWAIVVLGMLRFYCWEGDRHWPGRQQGECSSTIEGRPILEVFRVVIMNIDNEKPGQLYGTIKINDGLGSQYIYNRPRAEYESISPNENVTLIGPDRPTSALDTVEVDFDLKDADFLTSDDEILKQVFTWNFLDLEKKLDTIVAQGVGNDRGNASLIYAVLANAVAATFDIKLVDGNGENPAYVYGTITARTGDFQNERIVLFEKKNSHDYVSVKPGESIPLLRSAMAVTVRDIIYIEANLWHHNSILADKEIANGKANYSATMSAINSGTSNRQIGGINVIVQWEKRS